ncbi:MAG TPA: hypothetical protein VGC13_28940 [Longimicrobium sp.]|jgi:hypothetical protein|uniref:hypothetical protein n=1 Tax=Longimicrobium sp. TaxID=2029185 RepID=UPI002EDAE6B3
MKLNPEELVVASFDTGADAVKAPGGTYEPTPMTFCYWCPGETYDCPIFTDPGTVVG